MRRSRTQSRLYRVTSEKGFEIVDKISSQLILGRTISRILLIAAPPFAGLLLTCSFVRQAGTTRWESLREALPRVIEIMETSGIPALLLFGINYFGNFGVIIVLSLLINRRRGRMRAFLFSAVCTLTLIMLSCPKSHSGLYFLVWQQLPRAGAAIPHWSDFLMTCHPIGLVVALILGSSISLLPSQQKHWLSRGMCPKCHYDLKGEIAKGCPECGWNRGNK
jgi:hypothetical protein